jgi:hypothetical protein
MLEQREQHGRRRAHPQALLEPNEHLEDTAPVLSAAPRDEQG